MVFKYMLPTTTTYLNMKLSKLCLNTVCTNLDTYLRVYQASGNEQMKREIEVLRRFYSFEILEILYNCWDKYKAERVPEKHFDFLINRFLKKLDTRLLEDYPWETIVEKFAEIGSSLESVRFRGTEPWEEIICHLPNLKEVEVEYLQRNFLNGIAKYSRNIKYLKIISSLDSEDWRCPEIGLNRCSKLKKISIEYSEYDTSSDYHDDDDDNVRPVLNLAKLLLENLPHLEELKFGRMCEVFYLLHKDNLSKLESITPYTLQELNLKNIGIRDKYIDDSLRICAVLCPSLKSLATLVQNQEHLVHVSKFRQLRCLDVYHYHFGNSLVDFDVFLKESGKKILFLKIRGLPLSVDNLLRSCPNLQRLTLSHSTFLNVSNDYMPILHELKFLEFWGLQLGESRTFQAATVLLSCAPNLESLCFIFCKTFIPDIQSVILKCCKWGSFEHMSFNHSIIEFNFALDVLIACNTLKDISFFSCFGGFQSEHLDVLKEFAQLLPNKPKIRG